MFDVVSYWILAYFMIRIWRLRFSILDHCGAMTSLTMSTTSEIVSNYPKHHSSSTPTLEEQLNQSESYPSETIFLKTDDSKYYSHKHSEDPFERSDFGNNNKCPWITKRQILVLSLINFAFFCQASCYALLAPFFPEEAEKKQLSSTQYGFVFGMFYFVVFILSPFMCKMVPTLSPKFLINSGVFFAGGATILLGTVIKSAPGVTFFSLSLLGRIVQALGSTALFTLGYTIVANEFTERRATALAIVEMFYGLGITIGPTIGGVLFEVGGFMLPFFLLGAILVCLSAIMICFLPETKCTMNENEGELWKIILNPTFIVDMVNILTGFLIVGFNEATLEPHVRQFGLTPSVVGLLFIASGGIYAVGTPVWGYVYDKIPDSYLTMYTSSIVCAASFLLLGPAPFLPVETTLWLVIIAQVLLGLGAGGKVIIGFNHSLRVTVLRGFPDDIPTLTIVSGLFNCTLALGGFIGPSIGGTLLDHMGYENGTMVLLGIELAVTSVLDNCGTMTSLPMSTTPEIVSNYIKNHSSSTPTLEEQLNQSESYPLETNFLQTDDSKCYSHKHSEDSFERLDFGNDNKCRWITKRQILILSLINFAFFCQASCYALLAPFFPEEAEKKQLSSTQYGLVFGMFYFVVFILSPFMCKMVPTLSPKFLINSGVFFTGGATILLGTVIKSASGATFFSLSLLGRIVQALGSTALFTLGYTIVANEFTERRATVLAIAEMFYGLGITIGPTIGGVLFEVGGFMLPFFLLGAILVCLSAIMICFLPETKCTMNENKGEFWKIILNPTFIVDMVNILTGFLIVGFNEATLESHVRQLGLTPSVVGLLFIASGGIYAVGTPVWGYVYDKIPDSYLTMYTSSIVCAASFLLLGPAPFIPLETTLWLVIIAQVLLGLGAGGKVIIGFNHSLRVTVLRGFPDDIPTLTIVSGLFTCIVALGGFIGPSIGGTLLDHMGYENGTMVLLGIELAVIKIASRNTIVNLLLLVGDNYYTFTVDINNQILWTIRGIKTYPIKWFFAVMKKYLLLTIKTQQYIFIYV
ncbi:uncharacterized protein LOC143252705 isoform X2 [Tachypleus tridentatus]|uniref:uncharacterized protein LOC143252705 isoform X2 n=2 Tax=Tachypleus tridentatus TaxID=6853 RepID=UPI003FD5B54E